MSARACFMAISVGVLVSSYAHAANYHLTSDALASGGADVIATGPYRLGMTTGLSVTGVGGTSNLAESVGFWRWGHLPVLDVRDPGTLVPDAFSLATGTPNPFRIQTTIRYAIPDSNQPVSISLRVYDVSGRLVRELDGGARSPGRYTATWDGRDAAGGLQPGGIYFCRLAARGFSATHRLLLLR
jgi:hypothetical protein